MYNNNFHVLSSTLYRRSNSLAAKSGEEFSDIFRLDDISVLVSDISAQVSQRASTKLFTALIRFDYTNVVGVGYDQTSRFPFSKTSQLRMHDVDRGRSQRVVFYKLLTISCQR